jgi:hypothetical protein
LENALRFDVCADDVGALYDPDGVTAINDQEENQARQPWSGSIHRPRRWRSRIRALEHVRRPLQLDPPFGEPGVDHVRPAVFQRSGRLDEETVPAVPLLSLDQVGAQSIGHHRHQQSCAIVDLDRGRRAWFKASSPPRLLPRGP